MSVILTMRSRQAVRALAQDLGTPATAGLPVWASAPLPDAHLDLVNVYGQADGWPAAQAMLHDHREILTSPQFRTTPTSPPRTPARSSPASMTTPPANTSPSST